MAQRLLAEADKLNAEVNKINNSTFLEDEQQWAATMEQRYERLAAGAEDISTPATAVRAQQQRRALSREILEQENREIRARVARAQAAVKAAAAATKQPRHPRKVYRADTSTERVPTTRPDAAQSGELKSLQLEMARVLHETKQLRERGLALQRMLNSLK